MRVAVFVDAGYLYVGGAVSLTGSNQRRSDIELRAPETVAKLKQAAKEATEGGRLLRIYWYDGLYRGRRSPEQDTLAITPDVKVRLGTVTAGHQKGVDSLIVTDLIELARNHAISDAVLLSGDEDLRIGVQIAQSFGVRVHLLGIAPSRGNQSNLLREEADTTSEWTREDITEVLSVKSGMELTQKASPIQAGVGASAEGTSNILAEVVETTVASMYQTDLRDTAAALTENPHFIPSHFDGRLLAECRAKLGHDLSVEERRLVRKRFREMVNRRLAESSQDKVNEPGT